MGILRRLALLGLAGLGAAVLAGPAFGAFTRPTDSVNTLGSTHFLVHYQSDTSSSYAISATQAGDVAVLAEQAYAAELAMGYPAPPSDGVLGGDGRIDIYVESLATGVYGDTKWDADTPQTSAFIDLAGNDPTHGLDLHTIAHELFHVIQMGIWLPPQPSGGGTLANNWLLEGSAEWMGYHVDGYNDQGLGFDLGPTDLSLDCRDPVATDSMCSVDDSYADGGYSRWPFFEYLSEEYGSSFLKDVFAQGAAGGSGISATQALANALAAKGTTLASTYLNWTDAELTGGYSVESLQGGVQSDQAYSKLTTGTETATLPTIQVPVNHLATRYLEFDRGGADLSTTGPCYAASLTLTVTIPSGVATRPTFWWNEKGSAPVHLTVNGSTATATLPWDTCVWASNAGFLALPNATTNVDAAAFTVSSSISVDLNTPATQFAPPDPITVNTPVTAVTWTDAVPSIAVFGPQLLTLSASDRKLRLIVESSAEGVLQVRLGALSLGKASIRPGNNDVRVSLPAGALVSVRRSAATSLLTITPLSPTGSLTGVSVVRRVQVEKPVTKTKAKAKAKAKANAKAKAKAKAKG